MTEHCVEQTHQGTMPVSACAMLQFCVSHVSSLCSDQLLCDTQSAANKPKAATTVPVHCKIERQMWLRSWVVDAGSCLEVCSNACQDQHPGANALQIASGHLKNHPDPMRGCSQKAGSLLHSPDSDIPDPLSSLGPHGSVHGCV